MVDIETLLRENAAQREQIEKLTMQVSAFVEQIAKLTDRVTELLAIAQRKHRKPAADKPPIPAPVVEGDAKRAFDERPKPPATAPRDEPEKTPATPTGRKALNLVDRLRRRYEESGESGDARVLQRAGQDETERGWFVGALRG